MEISRFAKETWRFASFDRSTWNFSNSTSRLSIFLGATVFNSKCSKARVLKDLHAPLCYVKWHRQWYFFSAHFSTILIFHPVFNSLRVVIYTNKCHSRVSGDNKFPIIILSFLEATDDVLRSSLSNSFQTQRPIISKLRVSIRNWSVIKWGLSINCSSFWNVWNVAV